MQEEKVDYNCQLKREGKKLNNLEVATQELWQDWMEAAELNKKRLQVKQAASHDLPPERRAAHLEREQQAKITGLSMPTKSNDRYPGWVLWPQKKPVAGVDMPASYQIPGTWIRCKLNKRHSNVRSIPHHREPAPRAWTRGLLLPT